LRHEPDQPSGTLARDRFNAVALQPADCRRRPAEASDTAVLQQIERDAAQRFGTLEQTPFCATGSEIFDCIAF
jgi:hypothetical protein